MNSSISLFAVPACARSTVTGTPFSSTVIFDSATSRSSAPRSTRSARSVLASAPISFRSRATSAANPASSLSSSKRVTFSYTSRACEWITDGKIR